MKKSNRIIIVALAVLLVLALGLWALLGLRSRNAGPTPTITDGDSNGSGLATPTKLEGDGTAENPATKAPEADLAGCAEPGVEIIANRFEVPARKISQPVISVGREADGAVGSPPKDQRYTVAWWNEGPKVGSTKGHVITTVHTWEGDVALGNVLNDEGEAGLHPGDIIRLSDGTTTVCYQYREKTKIAVATYDPSSDIWINPNGKPQLTIMICWDYHPGAPHGDDWDSRILFYADPVNA